MNSLGKMLLLLAGGLAIVGVLFMLGSRLGLGSLPGDIRIEGESGSCFIPIASSIVISLLLTLILNLIIRWFR